MSHFYTLEEFQDQLRRANSKSEYCSYIKNAQHFFSAHVPLQIIELDSAAAMVKELKRQSVMVNGTLQTAHMKMGRRCPFLFWGGVTF